MTCAGVAAGAGCAGRRRCNRLNDIGGGSASPRLHRRTQMIRLSIPVRQALAKLTLPVLIAAAFGLMLLGKADTLWPSAPAWRWPTRWRRSTGCWPSRSPGCAT